MAHLNELGYAILLLTYLGKYSNFENQKSVGKPKDKLTDDYIPLEIDNQKIKTGKS
jgi:hypothetical protein